MRDNRYTQQEVDSAINNLTKRLNDLSLQKKSINEQMKNIKNNIKFYQELDCSQLKVF
jgi:chaperonin cofactor prefoldin